MKELIIAVEKELSKQTFRNTVTVKGKVKGKKILLKGKVKTYYMKQMAQVVAMRVIANYEESVTIKNQISVESDKHFVETGVE